MEQEIKDKILNIFSDNVAIHIATSGVNIHHGYSEPISPMTDLIFTVFLRHTENLFRMFRSIAILQLKYHKMMPQKISFRDLELWKYYHSQILRKF